MRGRNSGAAGLSLLEVVVSMFLFAAVAILLLNLYPATLLGMNHNRWRLQAELLASSTLSRLRQAPFDDLAVGTDKELAKDTLEGVEFTTRLKVVKPPRGNPDRLRVLQITTSWPANGAQSQVTRELWVVRATR